MKNNLSFVDFYNKHGISPVSQNISNLEEHFKRRNSLLTSLGIPAIFVKGSSVLEFGPGSGHNATYIASLSPNRYHLVDGSDVGIRETERLLSGYEIHNFKAMHSLFLDYKSSFLFDIVWAEGCIPHQSDPISILEYLSSFTNKSGIFVITTINGISHLSETIRRLASHIHINSIESISEKVNVIRPLHRKHLQHLKGMSRPIDDWILDVIIQPLHKSKLLSIPDAINVLQNEYDIYGSSPKFITDWRWYKEVVGVDRGFNQTALDSYYQNNLNLIDYRFEFSEHSPEYGVNLEKLCSKSWDVMRLIQDGDSEQWGVFTNLLNDISNLVEIKSPVTAKAISEASSWLQDGAPINQELKYFPEWWGRGQQYVSFIRK
jgi:SAM-dependent methyltransferase